MTLKLVAIFQRPLEERIIRKKKKAGNWDTKPGITKPKQA